MYVVQWVSLRGKPCVRFEEHEVFTRALRRFMEKEDDSMIERVELIIDKGYGAAAREHDGFQSIEEVVEYLEGDDDDG